MPKLRKYKPGSPKSGYYIRANVGGGHPVTLQVTELASRIFRHVGYQADDSIPTKLVWAMFDLGLLYTKKSLDPDAVQEVSTEDIFTELNLGNRLTPAEKNKLTSYIESYEGEQRETLQRLKRELETEGSSSEILEASLNTEATHDLPQTKDEAISELYMMCSSASEFRGLKNSIDHDYLIRSLQTFYSHPNVDPARTKVESNILRYRFNSPNHEREIWVEDHRSLSEMSRYSEADYVVRISEDRGHTKAVIVDGDVTNFTKARGGEYDLERLKRDLEWILPPSPVEMDESSAEMDESSAEMYEKISGTFTEYNGLKLEPVRAVRDGSADQLQIVEVDRISNQGNPIAFIDEYPQVLDQGEPGNRYLVKRLEPGRCQVISKVIDE